MQPYSHSTDPNLYARGSPELPPLSPGELGRTTLDSRKRTGLEPPEGNDGDYWMNKRTRFDGPVTAESVFLSSQTPHLPKLGRASMLGSHIGSNIPDMTFARYFAEKQSANFAATFCPAPSPLLPPSTIAGSFDIGGLPLPPLAVGRSQLLDPLPYTPAPLGFTASAQGAPMPLMQSMQSVALAVPRRPSQATMPRRTSQTPMNGSISSDHLAMPRLSSPSANVSISSDHLPLPRLSSSSGGGDDPHAHFSSRICIDISIDQDPNWLSELQCYVRRNLLEVCWASREDVAVRNASKKVSLDQVGIRCRFCAHKPPGSRAQRSSAFPSSIPQLYQSFTMMLRDHFDSCTCIPDSIKERYMSLKSATCQGATEAKKYWSYSAQRLGMVDSGDGIVMNEATRMAARSIPAFGYVAGEVSVPLDGMGRPVVLVRSTDHRIASGFLYILLSHFYRIELLPSERKGNRKSLRLGLPGFGCRHCCSEDGRFGMSRVFPARRRTLPVRVADLYDHICRCNLCSQDDKAILARLREETGQDPAQEKQFLDLVWERLGHNAANP